MVRMTYLRWIALTCFVLGFGATFTSYYEEHHYLWLTVWAMGMACLVFSWRREPN